MSTYGSDFPFDFGFAFTKEQMSGIEEVQTMIKEPPDWLEEWAEAVGTELESPRTRPGFRGALLPPAARPDAERAGRRVSGHPARRVRGRGRPLMRLLASRGRAAVRLLTEPDRAPSQRIGP